MKTTPILPGALGHELTSGSQIIHAAEKDQWLASLAAGQILKGRIMRHYGESRYGISFSGQERIVDSAIPLSVGDVLTGKVIGVSERSVSIQRVVKDKTEHSSEQASPKQIKVDQNPVIETMKQLGIQLNQIELNMIESAAKGFEQPGMAVRVGLYLSKLGIPVSSELVRLVSRRVLESQPFSGSKLNSNIPELVNEPFDSSKNIENANQAALIEYLARYFSEQYVSRQRADTFDKFKANLAGTDLRSDMGVSSREDLKPSINKNQDQTDDHFLAYFSQIMNAQTGAANQHRFQTFPIMINGRVAEFDLALFDHPFDENEAGVRSRHLKFSLTTEFGLVSLDARVLNNRVHLHLAADSQWLTKEFEQYRSELSMDLEDVGWMLEVADYDHLASVSPAATVIEHVLAQDSLQKFM